MDPRLTRLLKDVVTVLQAALVNELRGLVHGRKSCCERVQCCLKSLCSQVAPEENLLTTSSVLLRLSEHRYAY